jgi:hypothetical protein
MDARRSPVKWSWRERLWLLAFLVTQLVGLWQCFGAWFFPSLVSHGE